MDTFYRSPLSPSILVNACLTACFCPADHQTAVVSSQTQLDELMDSAPCTTRGDGAEERAKAWGTRCRMEVSKAGLDFERDALLTLGIRHHRPGGPLTPDLGFFRSALIDKTRIRQLKIGEGKGHVVLLPVEGPTRR
jgi:hypothetical protein